MDGLYVQAFVRTLTTDVSAQMSYLTLESWKFLIANAFSETCYGC